MRPSASRFGQRGLRYPFTLVMLAGLGLGALVGSVWLADFPKLVLRELGFSARDLGPRACRPGL